MQLACVTSLHTIGMSTKEPGRGINNTAKTHKNTEEVLIEIDGRFELVSATDMEAINPPPPGVQGTSTSPEEKVIKIDQATKQTVGPLAPEYGSLRNNYNIDSDSNSPDTSDTVMNNHHDNLSTEATQSEMSMNNENKAAHKISETPVSSQSQSGLYKPKTSSFNAVMDKESVAYCRKRTKSAPGFQLPESNLKIKKLRNEEVFRAWLVKKNAELIGGRRLKESNEAMTREEIILKRQQSESAYRSWLESKTRRTVEEKKLRSNSIKSTIFKEVDSAGAFRKWLEEKRVQKQKENELERKRLKEKEEKARKVDTNVAQQAYQQWILKKNIQAKQEAEQKAMRKQLFLKEARKLKESTASRFEGF